jgi:DNA-binding NarL/FixJ family response regulator
MIKKSSIIVVDDHSIFREGIKSLIKLKDNAEVVAEASNGKEFLELLPNFQPDLIVMDIDMPLMNGIEASRIALEKNPELNILVLTMFGDETYYQQMVQAGVKGFVLKTSKFTELEKAIYEIANGGNYFSNELLRKIIFKYQPNKEENKISFTDREKEVLELTCKGMTNEEIANNLNLSLGTIKGYRSNLLEKTTCKNTASLIIYAIKNSLIHL